MEEAVRSGGAGRGGRSSSNGGEAPRGRVAYPSGRFRTYSGGNLFRLGVPENWRELPNQNSVTFAPEGAYGDVQGQFVFTHGAMVGVEQAQSNNLQQATEQFIRGLAQGDPSPKSWTQRVLGFLLPKRFLNLRRKHEKAVHERADHLHFAAI
ncbi:MAG: hypothetical protein H0T45_12240 [Pyrinomonadaceae bacterium]|nr:hypothetical protein [Pyrinomonadaceae bacterium]